MSVPVSSLVLSVANVFHLHASLWPHVPGRAISTDQKPHGLRYRPIGVDRIAPRFRTVRMRQNETVKGAPIPRRLALALLRTRIGKTSTRPTLDEFGTCHP